MEIAQTYSESLQESPSDAEACIRTVLRYYRLASEPVRPCGDTMLDVYNVLSDAGLDVNGYRGSISHLRGLAEPAILHLNADERGHRLVVCFGYDSGKFMIGYPRRGIRRHSAPDLARRWTSRMLLAVDGPRDQEAERFKCLGVAVVDFGFTRTLVSAQDGGAQHILSRSETEALLSADVFRTLEGHEAWLYAQAARRGRPVADPVAKSTLDVWVDNGLLVSENRLRESLSRLVSPGAGLSNTGRQITSIGIPSRARNQALARALRGYLSNMRAHDVSARCVIAGTSPMDNGAELDVQLDAMQAEFGTTITRADDRWKAGLSSAIAAESSCDPALLRFALVGGERRQTNYGANRNALLLATLGELCVQVDDDTVLPGLAVPGTGAGIDVSSKFDPNEYWFEESGWESAHLDEMDFIRLHEDLLGRHPGEILSEYRTSEIFVDDLEVPLLQMVKHPDARIGLTFLGHEGDAGTATNSWRLFLQGDSLGRLVRPGYADRIRRRDCGRTVPRRTISDGHFCVAMNLGLDNRDVLPPFMPVGRNEDGVFSAALAACLPSYLRGFREGYVVRHRPVELRRPFESPVRFEGLNANDLIAMLIRERGASRPPGSTRGMRWLGKELVELGSVDQTQFDRLVRSFVRRHVGITIGDVERSQASYGSMCSELAADLAACLHSMEAFAVRSDCDVPIDLDGSPSERRTHFRARVRTYGKLLIHWPDVVQCARYVQIDKMGIA